jgi:hypothetical protein
VGKGAASGVNCSSTSECTFTTPSSKTVGTVDIVANVTTHLSAKTAADHFTFS